MSGNQISELPEFLSEMTELKELKIGNNPIAQNPESVEAKIKVINPKITLYFLEYSTFLKFLLVSFLAKFTGLWI